MSNVDISHNIASVLKRIVGIEKGVGLNSSSKGSVWIFKSTLLGSFIDNRKSKRLSVTRIATSWDNATVRIVIRTSAQIIIIAITLRLLLMTPITILRTLKQSWRYWQRGSFTGLELGKSQTDLRKFHRIFLEAMEVCRCSNGNFISRNPCRVLVGSRFNCRFEPVDLWNSIRFLT